MKNLKFTKEFVLNSLKTNRAQHELIFKEALKNYLDRALIELNLLLEKVRKGEKIKLWVNLQEPVQHLKEYDRAISMLENSTESNYVELSDQEYSQFIQDDWHWRNDFLNSNSLYSGTAMASLSNE